jgi:hypothetical protein
MTSTRQGQQATMRGAFTGGNITQKQQNGNKPTLKRPASTFIQIYEQYAIGADANSWYILRRRRYRGGYKWEPIAWYATFEQCARALAAVGTAVRSAEPTGVTRGK